MPAARRVTERPIAFTAALVRAIVEGRKTQTRRPIVPQPRGPRPLLDRNLVCRFGAPGERLWIRQRAASRASSRIILEITARRLERLTQITRADAIAEGFDPHACDQSPIDWFRELWDGFYASRGLGWRDNPWVWVIEFRLLSESCAAR